MKEREALKLQLEALRMPCSYWNKTQFIKVQEAIKAGEEALAQPEQEPVTWRNAAIRVGEDLCSVGPFGYYDMTAEQWLDWALGVVTVHSPPPQRTWVGLTDDEIVDVVPESNTPMSLGEAFHKFAKAIEVKLKEKNT